MPCGVSPWSRCNLACLVGFGRLSCDDSHITGTNDVTTQSLPPEVVRELDLLAETILARAPLVAFTGAGISTESGIPDYRGRNGLWTSGSATPVTYQEFMSSPERRIAWWRSLPERYQQGIERQPNAGHHALVRLQAAGVLLATVTQNIDGLHRRAGTAGDRLVELHGNGMTIRCTFCGTTWPVEQFLPLVAELSEPPACELCGGILKSGVVAFGESLRDNDLRSAFAFAERAGVMLVIGSTLLVQPAARVPEVALRRGAHLAIINHGETALDDLAGTRLDAPAGAALTYLTQRVLGEQEV